MSDNRLVETDNKHVRRSMTTAIVRSHRMLVELTTANHRGPSDTWTAARDRTARQLGIEETYAARIWNRWQSMKDVSGEAFMRIKEAYDARCEAIEARGEHYRTLREELWHGRQNGEGLSPNSMGRADGVSRHPAPAETREAL